MLKNWISHNKSVPNYETYANLTKDAEIKNDFINYHSENSW